MSEANNEQGGNRKVRYAMVVDLRRCIGCHSCSVACKAENDVPLGVWRTWVKQINKGDYPNVRKYFLPIMCNHCANPICVQNCPVKATYQRDDGIVKVDEHRCIGCRYCISSCPYGGVRHINPLKRHAQSCYFCVHRVEAGLLPACVDTCPSGARVFGDMNDPNSEVAKLLAGNPVQVLKPDRGTDPRVFYIGADVEVMKPREGGLE